MMLLVSLLGCVVMVTADGHSMMGMGKGMMTDPMSMMPKCSHHKIEQTIMASGGYRQNGVGHSLDGNPGHRDIKLMNNTVMTAIKLFESIDKPRLAISLSRQFICKQRPTSLYKYMGKSYYDYDRKMQAFFGDIYDESTGMTNKIMTYTDYNKQMQWTVSGGNCTSRPYKKAMTAPCLSANATYLGTSVVGSRDHHIHAHTYMAYNDEYESYIRTTATMDGVPLVSIFLPVNPDGLQQNLIHSDYIPTIRDPSVFTPPQMCMMS